MNYRAVIFDLGGVVLDAPLKILADFEIANNLPADFINRIIREGGDQGPWQCFERGELEPAEFCRDFEAAGAQLGHTIHVKALLEEMASRMTVRQPVIDTIRRLRDQEILVAALTNNWAVNNDLFNRLDLLREEFDYFIESHKVGFRKPETGIYRLTLDEMGVRAKNIIFLDDLGQNLKPARTMGMYTIKVAEPEVALKELWAVLEEANSTLER